MGIGDWGLGIGDWGLGPIPNPQSPFDKSLNILLFTCYLNLIIKFYIIITFLFNYYFINEIFIKIYLLF